MLPVVLIILCLLSALGGALLSSVTLDVSIGDAYQREIQVRALAEGGIEQAREWLRMSGAPPVSTTTPFITAAEYTVFLESETNGVYVLRSVAQIRRARKTVEMSVVRSGFPSLPMALNMAGDVGLDPRLTTPAGINRLVDEVSSRATEHYTAPVVLNNIGNGNDYRVTVVDSDCDFGPGAGYGVLVVRGRLTLVGDFTWNGLILVVGEGDLSADMSAQGRITGAVFLARTVDNNPAVANFDPARIAMVFDPSETDPARYRSPFKPISVREF
jgi:hypothetical protein